MPSSSAAERHEPVWAKHDRRAHFSFVANLPPSSSLLAAPPLPSCCPQRHFLETYATTSGEKPHDKIIDTMCASNGQSLNVSYMHLGHHSPVLAIWLADTPKQMLELFDEVAKEVVLARYPEYWVIHDDIHVRITGLPLADSLRDLRQMHLNVLIKVSGVVTRRTGVFPQLKLVRYTCGSCGSVSPPIYQNSTEEARMGTCPDCQATSGFSINTELTVYRNYQKITIQESPGTVPAGRVPRYKDVILLADLIDCARPGEEVEVTGIYTNNFDRGLNARQGFPVFATVLEANYVQKKSDALASNIITEDERAEIDKLAKDPRIVKRIERSIAPSIYGNGHVKLVRR